MLNIFEGLFVFVGAMKRKRVVWEKEKMAMLGEFIRFTHGSKVKDIAAQFLAQSGCGLPIASIISKIYHMHMTLRSKGIIGYVFHTSNRVGLRNLFRIPELRFPCVIVTGKSSSAGYVFHTSNRVMVFHLTAEMWYSGNIYAIFFSMALLKTDFG
ncbi:hypothetical protein L7F22_067400 [Adiantum nelumboides]|nr:hypothetical protein [Adiantum nelumboides]